MGESCPRRHTVMNNPETTVQGCKDNDASTRMKQLEEEVCLLHRTNNTIQQLLMDIHNTIAQLAIISTPSNNRSSINPTRTTPLQYSSMSSNPMSVRASTPSSTRGDSNPNLEVPFHLF